MAAIASRVQDGHYVDYTPTSGDVAAGDVVVRGQSVQIADRAIANGSLGSLATCGVYDLPKDGTAIGDGNATYWNSSNNTATSNSSLGNKIGPAIGAAAAGDATVRVKLRPN